MTKFRRKLLPILNHHLKRGKSILLLGPRQVGKTTLLKEIKSDLTITLLTRGVRQKYEMDPDSLMRELKSLSHSLKRKPLIVLDEIQKVPSLLDPIQAILDEGLAQFILTGSSARKLRRHEEINLLPGRLVQLRLDPIILPEMNHASLEALLLYGSLPGILLSGTPADQEADLATYAETYLEEEVRSEALVRKMGEFARFLQLAGIESGNIINCSKISSDLGVHAKTVAGYFEILEDCLIAERIDPISKSSTRKKLTRSSRYLIFDMGVRRLCADEGVRLGPERMGQLFEQWVGLELLRQARLEGPRNKLRFWRDPDGPEVDWILESHGSYYPVEVKWTRTPTSKDTSSLKVFLGEYKEARHGFIICRCDQAQRMDEHITALPWNAIEKIIARLN